MSKVMVGTKISMAKYVIFPMALIAGCASETAPSGGSSDILEQDQAFVPISRALSSDVTAKANALGVGIQAVPDGKAKDSFYIAVSKKELNKRYFLSAYLKQAYPGSVGGGAAATLGTRVVTFREQNGKLFVFDAQDGRASSDTFDPSLIIEAYPLVEQYAPFLGLPGHDKYVLFDPAAGLNRFGVVSDFYARGSQPLHFQVDLSYLQNFRRINDGSTFEQVFTGAVNDTLEGDPASASNWYTASGTLGIGLRKYTEGEGFQSFNADSVSQDYFFRQSFSTNPLLVKNTGEIVDNAARWNIRPGMKPIKWLISDQFVKLGQEYPKYDIVGAIKAGVENWNEAFGFEALVAEVASPNDSYADDDKNYFIYDADPTYGFAFADWRLNPNSGEIRGASVYFNGIWLTSAIEQFDPPAGAVAKGRTARPEARPRVPRISWGDFRSTPLCNLWAPDSSEASREIREIAKSAVSPKEKVEKFLTHVAVHEVGHTLGLRHNFKGSLLPLPQQSSVMEYILDPDAVDGNRDHPGPYDVDAIKLLYGLSQSEPAQPFCTDDATEVDPTCATFDRTEDPLAKDWGATYNFLLGYILRGEATIANSGIRRYVRGTSSFLRAGTAADQARAWTLLNEQLAVGVDHTADNASHPGYTDRLSEFQNYLLNYLYLGPLSERGAITKDPVLRGATLTSFTSELKGVITNSDGYRGWNTRRASVDVLKKLQVQPAYEALVGAKAKLVEVRKTLPEGSSDAMLTDDLLARINSAISPYFTK